ncbi:formaldehyde dehydrogenase, glutathione-independent [Lentibacillus halophilus]|uniref:Formaldehyde dehydrogenase, glutathione-independent n=1 Tax=Lentibacillus halophilus TaxID=295065 RepID=A0ABP3IYW4_9BACI
MAGNRGVVYKGNGQVEVESIGYPDLTLHDGPGVPKANVGRKCEHGVIIKNILTNICGSDQHMVRGRTTVDEGMVLGHEITGEIVEVGRDVENMKVGDIVSVPFNVACGRCKNCRKGETHICLNVNPEKPGGAYGYVDMGGWVGGQSEYVMVPYADFQLLKFPDKDQAMDKLLDLTMLSDIFPTGFHGAINAGVTVGSSVYVAGAGPVGLAAAHSAQLLGAAVVIVGDLNEERLKQARSFGCETINLKEHADVGEQIDQILGSPEVDSAIDAVGFEAYGPGTDYGAAPATVLNTAMDVVEAGGSFSVPGIYVTEDPGAKDKDAQYGSLKVNFGLGWSKAHSIHTGQTPAMRYQRQLMNAILHEKADIANVVNAQVISLDEAPQGYADFDSGVAKKFVIDPHGVFKK